ncbi:MAG TPA: FAD-binding oxidoreductase [Myxococcaceae bacterium]|nr:FAD-binding oxidoreductase [Myxococcaceae bacterium]
MSWDVLVVGGGVVGWSVAHHLARRGAGRIAVADRGGGSTERATGGFRAQFATEVNVRLSLLSRQKLLVFGEETGVDPGFVPAGYLFLAGTEAQREQLAAAREVQRAAGCEEAAPLEVKEIVRLAPWIRPLGVVGGMFSAADGFIRPMEIRRGYMESALQAGVQRLEAEVVGIERTRDALRVRTPAGTHEAGVVVNAAGAWAGRLGAMVGVEIPIEPLRRQVAVTVPTDALPPSMPMIIYPDGFHLRVRDGRVLLLWPSDGAADPFDVSVEPEWTRTVLAAARERVPALARVPLESTYAGLYEMSPDEHALLGLAPGLERLFLVNGSSGHGVMHAPALGQLAAEMLTGRAPSLDVTALRPARFAEGRPNPVRRLL